jgi:hypothetical protein
MGLTTLGIAGLLIANVPSGLPFAGSAAETQSSTAGQTPARDAERQEHAGHEHPLEGAPTVDTTGAAGAPGSGGPGMIDDGTSGLFATSSPDVTGVGGDAVGVEPPDSGDVEANRLSGETPIRDDALSIFVVLAGAFLIAGLGLFAIRWTARRFG